MLSRELRKTAGARCDETAGDGRDAYAPNVGTRIFDIDDGASLTDDALSGSHTYNVDVKHDAGTSGQHAQDVSTLVSQGSRIHNPKNLYFRIRTTGQSVPFTTGSGNNQTTTYQARYTTTFDLLYGGEGWLENDYFYVWMEDAYYKVTIEAVSTTNIQANLGLIRPNPTPFDTETTITAASILGDIRQEIINTGNFTSTNVKQIGNGLYITRPPAKLVCLTLQLLQVIY